MTTLLNATATLLARTTSPASLKQMSLPELTELSAQLRQQLIESVSRTGGHLASNLGIVEITVGLHHVFDSPKDKILWDVGHQAYVHKMLTGRQDQFDTLRQYKGLSGFINPLESEHDAFIAGHSSTSVSLAVGMAIARDHLQEKQKVIAVIGDGGLTGGMALEALNHLGHIQRDVIIILNDNEMSISENLGGYSMYMKRIKETFFYRDIAQKLDQIENSLERIHLKPAVWPLIDKMKQEAKHRLDTPGMVFEKLGVNYTGPVDGHDVGAVVAALKKVKQLGQPQLVHVITKKGKGFSPAEADAIKYHGVTAFSLDKVDPPAKTPAKAKTYSQVFTDALIELAEVEPNMVAITPATAEGSGLVKFGKAYPERFFDVAICEQHAVTMAAGMAKEGLKPVVSIYSTFLQRAIDQVVHDVAILNLPVIFGIDRGGLVEDGETHQGVFDIAFLRAIPNLTVYAPKDTQELRNMLFTLLHENKGPAAVRFPRDKAIAGEEYKPFEKIDLGSWSVEKNGDKVAILAFGAMVETAKQALPALAEAGIKPLLVNAHSAKPLDERLLEKILVGAANNFKVITLEEGCRAGGFGAAVMEWAANRRLSSPDTRLAEIFPLAIGDSFVEHGARSILLDLHDLSPAKVAEFVRKVANLP